MEDGGYIPNGVADNKLAGPDFYFPIVDGSEIPLGGASVDNFDIDYSVNIVKDRQINRISLDIDPGFTGIPVVVCFCAFRVLKD